LWTFGDEIVEASLYWAIVEMIKFCGSQLLSSTIFDRLIGNDQASPPPIFKSGGVRLTGPQLGARQGGQRDIHSMKGSHTFIDTIMAGEKYLVC